MKISYSHLKKLIDFDLDPEALGKVLTSTGLEVEGIETIEAVKGGLKGLVVGEVMSCEKHPDADKLKVTKINVGGEELLDIVCGAPNVAQGQKVIVALVGTTLYPTDGEPFTIKKSKIRGAVSEGMLCAEDEIGTGRSHDGILVLDPNLEVGQPIAPIFNKEADYQIEIGLTPNRADAASHLGVARDIKAALDLELKYPEASTFEIGTAKPNISVQVNDLEACPRFCGLEIQNVEVKESPEWLKRFLTTVGVNSINNLVDITNYICHFLGQPMHIFDADQIKGGQIIVQIPEKGTKVTTLDGIERILSGFDLAICNTEEPMAIAGVFGGEKSGVTASTKNIFLEVAYFDPSFIRKTANHHSLKTDASFRYERGTDPNMPPLAIKIAAELILSLSGGVICDSLIDIYPNPIADFDILLKYKNIDRLLGKKLEPTLIKNILSKLDIVAVSETAETLHVKVPPYRVDVTREADVIEEILRIYGFDNIELSSHMSSDFIADFPAKEAENLRVKASENLAAKGFFEIQSLSIVKPADNAHVVNPENTEAVKLLNPLSEDLSVMRQSMLFSGLNAIVYNVNRRSKDLKFFEFGRTYHKVNNEESFKIKENKQLAIWITGNVNAETWSGKPQKVAYKDLYQVVVNVFESMRVFDFETAETTDSAFAYGLDLLVRKKPLAKLGLVKKNLLKQADLKQDVFYAEIDWDLLSKLYTQEFSFKEISKYPEVRRDLSLVLPKTAKFEQVKKVSKQVEKKLLKEINVFDIYEGDKLEENQKSYSVSFVLQDIEKTLNDAIIDKTMQKLIAAFENELGAIIRK